MMFRTQPTVGV